MHAIAFRFQRRGRLYQALAGHQQVDVVKVTLGGAGINVVGQGQTLDRHGANAGVARAAWSWAKASLITVTRMRRWRRRLRTSGAMDVGQLFDGRTASRSGVTRWKAARWATAGQSRPARNGYRAGTPQRLAHEAADAVEQELLFAGELIERQHVGRGSESNDGHEGDRFDLAQRRQNLWRWVAVQIDK